MNDFDTFTKNCLTVWAIWVKYLLPPASNGFPKCKKSPNLVTLVELYSGYKSNIWMLKSTLCVAFKECNEQVGLGKSYSKRSTITIHDCTTVINSKFLVISTLQSQITIEER